MKKIFLFMMLSVDGYFEGPKHELDWHNVDGEFVDFAVSQLAEVDTLIFGRKTYELMSGFWPTDHAARADPKTAKAMNRLNKLVFSKTLRAPSWENTQLFNGGVESVLGKLKQQPGKSMAVLGSSNLCLTLLRYNLLDEIRLMTNPVILGEGNSLFTGLESPCQLTLTNNRTFKSGNVLSYYNVDK